MPKKSFENLSRKPSPETPEKESKSALQKAIEWALQRSPWKTPPSEEIFTEESAEEYISDETHYPQESNNDTQEEITAEEDTQEEYETVAEEYGEEEIIEEEDNTVVKENDEEETAEEKYSAETEETKPEVFINNTEKEAYEKLTSLCKQAVEKLREKGITCLDQYGRITMESFLDVRSQEEVAKDNANAERLDKKYSHTNLNSRESYNKRKSEYLEMMVFVIFAKCTLDKGLAVVRTTNFDDYTNGVDTLMINTETGEIIANVDETLDLSDAKQYKAYEMNERGGGKVAYPITATADGTLAPSETPIKNIPVTVLPPPQGGIVDFILEMDPSIDVISEADYRLYEHFIDNTKLDISDAALQSILDEKEKRKAQKMSRRH